MCVCFFFLHEQLFHHTFPVPILKCTTFSESILACLVGAFKTSYIYMYIFFLFFVVIVLIIGKIGTFYAVSLILIFFFFDVVVTRFKMRIFHKILI